MPEPPKQQTGPILHIQESSLHEPKLELQTDIAEELEKRRADDAEKFAEIEAGIKAGNEKTEKEKQEVSAAIVAKNAPQKPIEVSKGLTDSPLQKGRLKQAAASPNQPKQYNPANISPELWIFNFGVAFVAWAHMRHVRAVKHDGMVDKGSKYMQTKAWDAGLPWFAIGAGVAAVRSALTGIITKPLTEAMMAEFGSEHEVTVAKKELDLATRKKNSDPQEIKEKEEAYKNALENHVKFLNEQLKSATPEDPNTKALKAGLRETEEKLEKLQQPSTTNTTNKGANTSNSIKTRFKEVGQKFKDLFRSSHDVKTNPSANSNQAIPVLFSPMSQSRGATATPASPTLDPNRNPGPNVPSSKPRGRKP